MGDDLEAVLFDGNGVQITSARLVMRRTTIPIRSIDAVSMEERPGESGLLVMFLIACVAGSIAAPPLTLLLGPIGIVLLIGIARVKRRGRITIRTTGREQATLNTKTVPEANQIVEALNRAIARQR